MRATGHGRRGSIPAHAGNTVYALAYPGGRCGPSPRTRGTPSAGSASRGRCPVHPRARGEHIIGERRCLLNRGPSPRTRGTRRASRGRGPPRTVHPRARGEHVESQPDQPVAGRSIPAHAGNTSPDSASIDEPDGPSPRTRGTRPARRRRSAFRPVHPRARGEHVFDLARARSGFSVHPRARGEHVLPVRRERSARRSIPAHAGNTLTEQSPSVP